MKILIVSNNKNKIHEIQKELIFNPKIELITLKDIDFNGDIPENGDTIESNAIQKVKYIYDRYKINCFSDDTGLEVYSLNNKPGVFSARYAGANCNSEDNMNKLLKELNDFENRDARFKTVISLILNNEIHNFEGIIEGTITKNKLGEDGFGYDPIFIPKGYDITFAQMNTDKKNSISHRAIALRKMINFIKNLDL